MSTTKNQIDIAIELWLRVAAQAAIQPSKSLCTVSKNGTVWLRNVNGHIGLVTKTGKCYHHIGGAMLSIAEEPVSSKETGMKADPMIEAVRELFVEIEKLIGRLPHDQQGEARRRVSALLSMMPSQQAQDEILKILFPCQLPPKGGAA